MARHSERLGEIAQVLVRHSLGYLVGVLALERFVPFHRGLLGHPRRPEPYLRPEHIRLALADLGATWIKLGQVLSTRSDLLPPDYRTELAKLQDTAPPVAPEVVQRLLVEDLGRPIDQVFAAFDPVSLAAASIGQVHAATLRDGTDAVVKVRRPDVVEQVEQDLEILANFAVAADRRSAFADQYDVVGLVQEFAQTLRGELDYLREGRNAERFAKQFAGESTVHIPRVFWETTTSRVLTLERVRGIKINDVRALDAAGIHRGELAERVARVLLKMVFEEGFFHADPHPGNFFVEPDGRLGLIDFGMVGEVDERTQDQLVRVLLAVTSRNSDRLVDALLDLGVTRGHVDRDALRRDLDHLVARYYGRPLSELGVSEVLGEVVGVVRRHRLQLPPNLALLVKTVAMAEGLAVDLDPEFRLPTVLMPYAERMLLRRYSPTQAARRLGEASLEAAQLGAELPEHVRTLIRELERGGLEIGVRPEGVDTLVRRLDRLGNRIVLGMLASAFVIGLSILMAAIHPPGFEAFIGPLLAVGFVLASGLAAYLAWTIVRSGRA